MYKPTHEELEKLGFKRNEGTYFWITKNNPSGMIMYDEKLDIFSTTPLYIYPKNLEDMKTMVDLVYNIGSIHSQFTMSSLSCDSVRSI